MFSSLDWLKKDSFYSITLDSLTVKKDWRTGGEPTYWFFDWFHSVLNKGKPQKAYSFSLWVILNYFDYLTDSFSFSDSTWLTWFPSGWTILSVGKVSKAYAVEVTLWLKEEGNAAEGKPKESEPILLIAFTVERKKKKKAKEWTDPTNSLWQWKNRFIQPWPGRKDWGFSSLLIRLSLCLTIFPISSFHSTQRQGKAYEIHCLNYTNSFTHSPWTVKDPYSRLINKTELLWTNSKAAELRNRSGFPSLN